VADLLIKNIKGLVQVRENLLSPLRGKSMGDLPFVKDAYITIEGDRISGYGKMSELPSQIFTKTIDATDRFVFPSFIDSHTHLIYPASREDEFVLKIKGATYAAIAASGGGILNSAKKLAITSEDELFETALERIREISKSGTGAVEIKSGYGLSLEGELKMLRVAKRLKECVPLAVRTTFLGAHAVPLQYSKQDYIQLVIREMIPAIAEQKLADYIDVFCEEGFFSPSETELIAEEGKKAGMRPRIHANQLGRSGGVQTGVKVKAITVDHVENIGDEEIHALAKSNVIPTALPGAAFFLNLPMPPARKMLENNLPLVIATDFNPGSSPTGNMPLMISLACIQMKMTPEEAINAATINAAFALELDHDFGSISLGKIASLFITRPMTSIAYLPYAFGSNLIEQVILKGKEISF
jgi:imidazolonepropionase